MTFIADLHIHSAYSRATSKQLNLEHLNKWAQLKGVQVVATGDFCHPKWLEELQNKLVPAEEGLYQLKPEYSQATQGQVPGCCAAPVRFILSTEISNIYKKGGKVRKNHNVVLAPSFACAQKIQERLARIGNIASDGRPILGLDAKNLLEIVLEADPLAALIPAHIWTPWFSVLGANSGFDSIEECFEDLTPYIFALETGLSSDPPMNWRLSMLDNYTLVSNSDAHSPEKLAREANIFHCELSYPAMMQALHTGDPNLFGGTIEFFPAEGKYHLDGHRKCGVCLTPEETVAHKEICPVCGKKLTLGVSYRVEQLADRPPGGQHHRILPYYSMVTLPEILAEVYQVGPASKTVNRQMEVLLTKLGPELSILRQHSLADIEKIGGALLAEGIRRVRIGQLTISAGFDGEYGSIHLFSEQERADIGAQTTLFDVPVSPSDYAVPKPEPVRIMERPFTENVQVPERPKTGAEMRSTDIQSLNEHQLAAIRTVDCNLLIVAGPGTGKTQTLTQRIAGLVRDHGVDPSQVLAVTFTNKAAAEMQRRLATWLDRAVANRLAIKTFHSLGAAILKAECAAIGYEANFSILDEADKFSVLQRVRPESSQADLLNFADQIAALKAQLVVPDQVLDDPELAHSYRSYQELLRQCQAFDFDDLILQPAHLLRLRPDLLEKYRRQFRWISVDEYQDINDAQYQLLRLLSTPQTNLCAIGDPDQAIYGFRGASSQFFLNFEHDFAPARTIFLERNYRSNTAIVSASGQVIEKNPNRTQTRLWSEIVDPTKLEIVRVPTEKSEAETVVHRIENLVGATSFFSIDSGRTGYGTDSDYSFKDIAVLVRLKAQVPALAEALIRSGIPFQSNAETPFWDQPKVRALLSYLQVMQNPHADSALLRILSTPLNGIDGKSMQVLRDQQNREQLSLWQTLAAALAHGRLSASAADAGQKLILLITHLRDYLHHHDLAETIAQVLTDTGLETAPASAEKRAEHWLKVITLAQHWQLNLSEFLEKIALHTETDYYDETAERVTLLTLHAAKGLEFPVVFICGCEDSLLPFLLKDDSERQIEEERRLFYVGMTRAREKLLLLHADSRFLYGKTRTNRPSRFLADIEAALKEQRLAEIKRKHRPEAPDDRQISLF